jgi:hypothetical protein
VLDSAPARYLGLTWRKDADDLVVLKSKTDDKKDGATYAILAWTGVGGSASGSASTIRRATRARAARGVVAFRRPRGPRTAARSSSASRRGPRSAPKKGQGQGREAVDPPTVDVWHPRDVDVMPKQKVGAPRDRQRSLLAAWPLEARRRPCSARISTSRSCR